MKNVKNQSLGELYPEIIYHVINTINVKRNDFFDEVFNSSSWGENSMSNRIGILTSYMSISMFF